MKPVHRNAWIASGLIVVAIAGAVAYSSGREYKIRFTEAQIQSTLAARAPFTDTYFRIFEVTLASPRVELIDDSDRVKAGADVILNIYVNDEPRPLGGSIDFSGSVDYVAERGEFFLVEPTIENLDVEGVPAAFEKRVRSVLELAIANFYETRPIYRLTGDKLEKRAARMLLRDVHVADDVLTVTLGLP